MELLIIRDWILKRIEDIEEEKKETAKDNWHYRLTSADKQFTVIDYDKDLARPYVKALLAKVNKLKEVKLLWATIIILIFSFFTFVILFIVSFYRIWQINKLIIDNKNISPSNIIQDIIPKKLNNPAFDEIWWTEIKTETPKNNHLFK